MTFRIFSKTHNLYTNSPLWPSNQRSVSDWFLAPNGDIIEAIDFGGLEFILEHHNPRDFAIEPWTGYFDVRGKKIYRGDILGALDYTDQPYHTYKSEVVWLESGFFCKGDELDEDSMMPLHIENQAWRRHIILGNIHDIEYND